MIIISRVDSNISTNPIDEESALIPRDIPDLPDKRSTVERLMYAPPPTDVVFKKFDPARIERSLDRMAQIVKDPCFAAYGTTSPNLRDERITLNANTLIRIRDEIQSNIVSLEKIRYSRTSLWANINSAETSRRSEENTMQTKVTQSLLALETMYEVTAASLSKAGEITKPPSVSSVDTHSEGSGTASTSNTGKIQKPKRRIFGVQDQRKKLTERELEQQRQKEVEEEKKKRDEKVEEFLKEASELIVDLSDGVKDATSSIAKITKDVSKQGFGSFSNFSGMISFVTRHLWLLITTIFMIIGGQKGKTILTAAVDAALKRRQTSCGVSQSSRLRTYLAFVCQEMVVDNVNL